MRCVRPACCRIDHHFCISMIRCDEHRSAVGAHGLLDLPQASIDGLDPFYSRLDLPGVTNHVGIREVHDDNVKCTIARSFDDDVGNSRRAHLRLQIVGCHLLRRHQYPLFSRKWLLHAAVEEVRYMCVLLGFGDTQISHVQSAHDVCQNVRHRFRWNHHRQAEVLVVAGHANVFQILRHTIAGNSRVEFSRARKIAAFLRIQSAVTAESARDLTHAVGSKVKTNTGILVTDLRQRLAAVVDAHKWHDEFVGHVFVVRVSRALHRIDICAAFALPEDHRVVSLRDALPSPVAIHRVVASVDGSDLAGVVLAHLLLQLFEIACSIGRQRVASVHKCVHKNAVNAILPGHLE